MHTTVIDLFISKSNENCCKSWSPKIKFCKNATFYLIGIYYTVPNVFNRPLSNIVK